MARRQRYDAKRRRSQMNALMRRFDGVCWWCRTPVRRAEHGEMTSNDPLTATRDHLILYRDDQRTLAANLVLSCLGCNRNRGSKGLGSWLEVLRQRGLRHNWRDLPPLAWGIPHPMRPPRDPSASSLWPSDDNQRDTPPARVYSDIRCDNSESLGEPT